MIFYKAIKYQILDYCINVLLSGVFGNIFKEVSISCKDVVPGMKFSMIKHGKYTFKKCTIVSIKPSPHKGDGTSSVGMRFRMHDSEFLTTFTGSDDDTQFFI